VALPDKTKNRIEDKQSRNNNASIFSPRKTWMMIVASSNHRAGAQNRSISSLRG
jgi:hypothetical protein